MGLSVSAAHIVVFIALVSAGVVFAGSFSEAFRQTHEAQAQAADREQAARNERFSLLSDGYRSGSCVDDDPPPGCQGTLIPESTFANFTNEGSRELELAHLTVLVDGEARDTDTLAVFEVRENATSGLWMPGETLEIRVDGQGDVDVTLAGPHGVRDYRRA